MTVYFQPSAKSKKLKVDTDWVQVVKLDGPLLRHYPNGPTWCGVIVSCQAFITLEQRDQLLARNPKPKRKP